MVSHKIYDFEGARKYKKIKNICEKALVIFLSPYLMFHLFFVNMLVISDLGIKYNFLSGRYIGVQEKWYEVSSPWVFVSDYSLESQEYCSKKYNTLPDENCVRVGINKQEYINILLLGKSDPNKGHTLKDWAKKVSEGETPPSWVRIIKRD